MLADYNTKQMISCDENVPQCTIFELNFTSDDISYFCVDLLGMVWMWFAIAFFYGAFQILS